MQSVVIEELSIHKQNLENDYKAADKGKTKIANRIRKINLIIKRLKCQTSFSQRK